MKNLVLCFSVVLLGFASCKKDKGPQLPPIGNEGKNIISWIMDGKFYESKGSEFFAGNNSVYSLRYDTSLAIRARAKNPVQVRLTIKGIFKGLNVPIILGKEYNCNGSIEYDGSVWVAAPGYEGEKIYETDEKHTGTVIVTYYDENIIGGTFKMNLVNDYGNVRHITEGQFDIAR